jgi:hypothetical protein
MGKARCLIEAVGREDDRLNDMLDAAWEPVAAQSRPRRSVTEKFIGKLAGIHRALPVGAIDLRVGGKRHGMNILMCRAAWSRIRLRSWNAPQNMAEAGLSVFNLGFIITREFIQAPRIMRANISIHALARAYQRMPQATDATVVAAMLPLSLNKSWNATCGSTDDVEFTVNGWRGRAITFGDDDSDIFGVRTYGDWD